MNQSQIEELRMRLREALPEKRYWHSVGVAYTASCLAMRYGYDSERAMVAGLLHDCAKYQPDDEIIKECRRAKLPITDTELLAPGILHGKLGAWYAATRYGIEDEEILSAIRIHTTGKPAMTLLEQIIFAADYMEPGRRMIPGLTEIRETIFLDLDKATVMILENTLRYLKDKGAVIDTRTEETLEYYKTRRSSL